MKKFCSECGHPLEISKKFCSDCGTLNPFFSISQEIPSARSSAIDTLRARKESIEKELEEIEREQKETLHKEKLRVEMEELEKQRLVRLEKEKEIKERFEREGLEASIKKELQQVKTETEQYQQQTTELLKELKGVVLQIDEENRKLKEELQQITKAKVVQPAILEPVLSVQHKIAIEPEPEVVMEVTAEAISLQEQPVETIQEEVSEEPSGNSWIMGVVVLLVIVSVGLFAYFYSNYKTDIPAQMAAENATVEAAIPSDNVSTTNAPENSMVSINTEAVVPVETVPEKAVKTDASVIPANPKSKASVALVENKEDVDFSLSEAKVKADLVGKNLSGCGITLKSASEIESIAPPTLVEDAVSLGYVKYKLSLKVVQANETYSVTPYLYYTPSGKFIRVDATNCE